MPTATSPGRLPLWIKLLFTAFVGVLVPYYWTSYGPTNFLYFCDVALFFTLAALWTERPIWASMPAVGILLPQALWITDFIAGALGYRITGMTEYMFDSSIPFITRSLSFFHFWLPLLLVWLVAKLGYDRRAFWGWTIVAWLLLLICYFLMPAPGAVRSDPNTPVNINYVYGFSETEPQSWMPPLAYLGLLMVLMPVALFLPTHWILGRLFGSRGTDI